MVDDTIEIPQKRMVKAEPFYADRTDKALKACEDKKYEALFMPEILEARIDSPNDHFIWENWFKAPSIRATGRTKQGDAVVIYAHIPNYLSQADNITKAIEQGLMKGAGKIPKDEFQKLYDMKDDKSIFVIDYETLRKSTSGVIKLKDAIKHPQTIPFCGGEQIAERYLREHKEVYGNEIGIWHSDDLSDEPFGRLLVVSGDCIVGLFGDFLGIAHFLGVRNSTGEACVRKIS